MRVAARSLRSVAVVAGLTFVANASCASDDCTLGGCGDVVSLGLLTTSDRTAIEGASVRMCVNDVCAIGVLQASTSLVLLIDEQRIEIEIADDETQLVVHADIKPAMVTLLDGDKYTAQLFRSDGSVLVSRAWIADYTELQVNHDEDGDVCGPVCQYAEVTELTN